MSPKKEIVFLVDGFLELAWAATRDNMGIKKLLVQVGHDEHQDLKKIVKKIRAGGLPCGFSCFQFLSSPQENQV